MKDLIKSALIAVTVMSGSMAYAGGPVIIEEGNGEEVAAQPASSIGILPILGALVLVCLIACGGGGEDDPAPAPEKCPGGCD